MLEVEAIEPRSRLGAVEELRGGPLDERQVQVPMATPDRLGLARRDQPIAGVQADRLEQPVAAVAGRLGHDERLLDEP